MDLRGKAVLVVGMARSGQAAARLALRCGARVICTDRRVDAAWVEGTEPVYGQHRRKDFLNADLVVVSPGVPASQVDLVAARAAGVTVIGELGFAASFLDGVRILAISGTNGKSTATHLLGQLCVRAGLRTFVGGNLGRPLSEALDDVVDLAAPAASLDVAVVEVSSYQMELPGDFHPGAAAILNLTPDHLERHGSIDGYGAHKVRMFARMGPDDVAILPVGDARLTTLAAGAPGRRLWLGGHPGVTVQGDALLGFRLCFRGVGEDGELPLDGFPLPGAHNRTNLAAAALLALCGGLRLDQIDVTNLTGLPHRMQPIADRSGVRWIDDSKATNVESALAACSGLDRPVVMLLGGRAKAGSAWALLAPPLRRARAVICLGEAGPQIAAALVAEGLPVHRVHSLEDAVARAAALAQSGDIVLLSPACASFDAFTDFEHRGRHYRALVEALP